MHHSHETIMLSVALYMSYSSSSIEKTTPECCSTINASDGGENISKLLQQTGSWCCRGGGCGTSPCFPVKVLLGCCCCRRRKQKQDLVPRSELTLFSSQHNEIYGKYFRCIPVAWGQLKWAGVVSPQCPHPTASERQSETKQLVCRPTRGKQSKARQSRTMQGKARQVLECLQGQSAGVAVFLGVTGGWRSRKEQTRLPDEFIPFQSTLIETHLCFQGCVQQKLP